MKSRNDKQQLPADRLIEERTRELLRSEQWFRMLFEKNGDAILLIRTDEPMFIDANRAALEMLRCSKDELLGLHPEKLSPPLQPDGIPSHDKAGQMIDLAVRHGSHRFEWTHCSPHRTDFPVEVLLTPIEESPAPLMIVTWRDLTERKNSEMQYKVILNTTMDGFWVNDMQGNFLEVNDTYVGMIGYSREELLTMKISDIEAVERPEETSARIQKILQTGHDRFESRHRCKDGRILDMEVSVNNLPGVDGRMAVFLRDISQQKRVKADLIEAKRSAEAANRAKSEFLANMSHEIRTPMNALMGMTRLVLETELTPRQREFLEKAYESSRALLTILNDILDYSKIEAGRVELNHVPFSIRETLDRVVDLFRAQSTEKGLELTLEITPDTPDSVNGDQLRLVQVLNNLVSNAVKFTDRGTIHLSVEPVRLEEDSAVVRFAVRDSGIGLSAEQIERLFRPFTQADGTITRQFGGTGLGLAISRRLVELMGGEITVSSTEGAGSLFTFSASLGLLEPMIPNASGMETSQRPASRFRSSCVACPDLHGVTILVVEDSPVSREIAAEFLKGCGATVIAATNGAEALDLMRNHRFHLVLMDLHMPIMDGLEATRRIRELPGGSDLPIIAVTAAVMQEDREKCSAVGMAAFIAKPIDPEELMTVVGSLLHRQPSKETPCP